MTQAKLNITPEVLRWAREEAGYTSGEIASFAKTEENIYLKWEKYGKDVPIKILFEISKKLNRQVAVFFLPHAPAPMSRPTDFRNFENQNSNSPYSKEVLGILRDTNYFREVAFEIKGKNYWEEHIEWLDKMNQRDEQVQIETLRILLNIPIDIQKKFKTPDAAFKGWRNSIESKLGILVFQFSMPIEELQGFCLTDKLPYVIVVNSNHTFYGRIFTIFHELAHIIRRQSGICFVDKSEENQKIENECNSFAGKFLIPDSEIVKIENLNELARISNKLKVSREAYLRRIYEAKLINYSQFNASMTAILQTYTNIKEDSKNKKGGAVVPEVMSKSKRGETLYGMILDALNSGKISYSTASNALGLRINRLLNDK